MSNPSNAAVETSTASEALREHPLHHTDVKDKVPLFEKLMYGLGSGSFQLAGDGVKGLSNQIFNIALGLAPSTVGLVMMITRFWDAFNDPMMGKISDNTRSRWGRRRPYIFVGSFLTAMAFILIWFVPAAWSPGHMNWIFAYFLISMLLFDLCATVQSVPYHTLGLEMTADYHERTSISAYKMLFSFCFLLILPWVFRIAQADVFGGIMTGMRWLSLIIAGIVVIGGVLPAIFVKERYYHIAKNQAQVPFLTGLKMTLSNRPFLVLTGIILTTGVGSSLVGPFGMYVIYYYIYSGDLKEGASMSAMAANVSTVCSIASLPLITYLSKRIGKVGLLWWLTILGIVGSLSKFIFYSKENPYLLFLPAVMLAPLAAGFWTVTTSMKADICDDDELKHGLRREGMFGAIGNWVLKCTMAIILLISGIMLEATGFDKKFGGNQPEGTLFWMRALFAAVPATFSFAALFLLTMYPLTERRMAEIRTALERRRSDVTDQGAPGA